MNALHQHIAKDGFRLRGTEMSRVDGFSDVVFGFALTLIVVSLEVPHTYTELHKTLLGFMPFFICFVFLITVWWEHFQFFRRYGLHDAGTILINSGLLFTLLFYVYPLKFLFSIVIGTHEESVFTAPWQGRELMIVYGAGFASIYFCLAGLYANAWRQRERLELTRLERILTLTYIWDQFGVGCVGLLCCLVAGILPLDKAGYSGFVFFAIGIYKTIHGSISGRYARKVREESSLS